MARTKSSTGFFGGLFGSKKKRSRPKKKSTLKKVVLMLVALFTGGGGVAGASEYDWLRTVSAPLARPAQQVQVAQPDAPAAGDSGPIRVYFTRPEQAPETPGDIAHAVVGYIDGTEHTLDVAAFELDNRIITDALVRAVKPGRAGPPGHRVELPGRERGEGVAGRRRPGRGRQARLGPHAQQVHGLRPQGRLDRVDELHRELRVPEQQQRFVHPGCEAGRELRHEVLVAVRAAQVRGRPEQGRPHPQPAVDPGRRHAGGELLLHPRPPGLAHRRDAEAGPEVDPLHGVQLHPRGDRAGDAGEGRRRGGGERGVREDADGRRPLGVLRSCATPGYRSTWTATRGTCTTR